MTGHSILPGITGVPRRIGALERRLDALGGRDGAARTRGAEGLDRHRGAVDDA